MKIHSAKAIQFTAFQMENQMVSEQKKAICNNMNLSFYQEFLIVTLKGVFDFKRSNFQNI